MGREIEFDYAKAIDKATRLFWKKGYARTTLRELLKVMKIGESSFYNSVQSKKNLYGLCLQRYRETVGRRREAALMSPPSVKIGLRAFFKTILDDLDDPKKPRLCLMAGSVSSDVLDDEELRRAVVGEMGTFRGHFLERLRAAQRAGELPGTFQPDIVAQVIGTYLHGLLRAPLIAYDRRQFEREIEVFLSGLGL